MADLATAYLLLVPSLKGASKTIEGELTGIAGAAGPKVSEGLGKGILSNIGSIAAKAASVFAGVFTAKKVFDFGKASFDAYADFEQLAGGVEKIFNEMDTAKVMEDANDAFINLNMSANDYLTAINQTGAMFAQTMGDEKGYETAKAGMQAISDYATGTGRDINELNSKFSMITRSTSSYQSIADQFAGILPATSKDFLEQAKAAGFLGETYESLTDVPVAEYQEAVTKMLEKGVGDMGLTNNTAKESLGTLSGSIATTKTAWQNLVTEIGKPDADIGARISDMMTALMGENGEGGLLRNVTSEVGTIARNMISGIGTAVGIAAQWLAANAPTMLSNAMTSIKTLLSNVGTFLVEQAPTLAGQAAQTLLSFIENITAQGPEMATRFFETLATIIQSVKEWLVANWPTIVETVRTLLTNVITAIVEHGPQILANIQATIQTIVSHIATAASLMLNAAITFMGGLITGTSQEGAKLHEWFAGLPQRLLDALGDLGGLLVNAGSQIIQGLWDGLKSKFGEVKEWVSGIGSWIASHKGPKQYDLNLLVQNGQWIMTGLEQGLVSSIPSLTSTLNGITATISAGIGGNATAGIGLARGSMTSALGTTYANRPPMAASQPAAPSGATSWGDVVAEVSALRNDLATMGIYLDGKTLVGGIATRMDRALVM